MTGEATKKLELPSKILVVDDDASVAQSLLEPLSRYHIKVDKALELDSALYLFNTSRYDAVLLEIEFEPMAGLALVQRWRAHDNQERRSVPFIMLAGNKNAETHQGMFQELGDLELLAKPFNIQQLLSHLNRSVVTKKRLLSMAEVQSKILSYYQHSGDFDKAANLIKSRLSDLGPKGLDLLYDVYEKAGKFNEALQVVDELLVKEPQNVGLLGTKGRLLMRLGRLPEAKSFMDQADAVAPLNIKRLQELGDLCLKMSDPEGAVKSYERLIGLSPDQPSLKFDLFDKFFDHGFSDHGVVFGKSHASPIEIVRHYNNKGVLLSKEGDTGKAISEYQRALNYYPKFKENYRILYNFALAQMHLKTTESYRLAADSLKHCLELAPDFEKARSALKNVDQFLEKIKKSA